MPKHLLLIIVISCFSSNTHAQIELGMRIGVNQTRINIVNPVKSVEIEPGYGWTGSIVIAQKINNNILLWATPSFTEKNYSEKGLGISNNVITTYKNLHLQLPILISYEYAIKNFYPSIKGGFYCAYWIYSRNSGLIPDIFSTTGIIQPGGAASEQVRLVAFNNKRNFSSVDRRMEMGAIITAEMGYKINQACKIILDYDYTRSFTSMTKEKDLNRTRRYNISSALSLGFVYELKRKN